MLNINRNHKRTIQLTRSASPSPRYVGWRIKHDAEMPMAWRIEKYGENLRNGLPEVYVLSETFVAMSPAIQHLSKDINPMMLGEKWRVLYDYMRAFTNKTGFNGESADPPLPPRADWVHNRDLTAELPAYDKVRICGGAFVTGKVSGRYLIVDTLSPTTVPGVDWLIEHPQFFFHAVNTTATGITRFPQGGGEDVLIPLFSRFEAKIPIEQTVPWSSDELPDPYRIYFPL